MEYTNETITFKCPNCKTNVKISETKYANWNNYQGGIIMQCNSSNECKQYIRVDILNPKISTIINDNGEKVDLWYEESSNPSFITLTLDDLEYKRVGSVNKLELLSKYNNVIELKKDTLVKGDIEKKEIYFDITKQNIHYCKNCKNSIEPLVYNILFNCQNEILKQYQSIMNNYFKKYYNPAYVVVKLPIQCSCGFKDEAVLYKKFNYGNCFTQNGVNELLLIGTENNIESTKIDRIGTKTECIEILEKFIFRWNFLFPKVLILTPFVGHPWMKDDKMLELWEWIKNYLDPNKSIFITRRATFNIYKKAFEKNNGVSLKFLEDYDLDNKVISNFISKQNFHAKLFTGFSSEKSEVLGGSFNLLTGSSFENLTYTKYDGNTFKNNFIDKLNIPIDFERPENVSCALIYVENNEFKSNEVKKTDIDKILI